MKNTEIEVIKILETDTSDSTENKAERFQAYREWVLSLNKESLKGVIVGCATFRLNNSNSRLFSSTKEEKERAKFNVEISNIYLDFAKEAFYCAL
jgi:hypothetical protein